MGQGFLLYSMEGKNVMQVCGRPRDRFLQVVDSKMMKVQIRRYFAAKSA